MKDYSIIIKNTYEEAAKAYASGAANSNEKPAEAFFKSPLYKVLISVMNKSLKKFETGPNKDYYKHIYITQGDYSKRKGYEGSIYESMREQASYIVDYVNEHPFAKYSILGVYADLWKLLTNEKWRIAFKKAFATSIKEKDKTIINGFRLIYVASVLAFESIAFKIVDFKFAIYSGIADEAAIDKIQNANSAMMKNLIVPAINLIVVCNNLKNPAVTLSNLYAEEQKGLKSTEAYNPSIATEAYNPEFSEEGIFEKFGKTLALGFQGISKGIGTLFSKHPKIMMPIALITAIVALLILAFLSARYIIYFTSVHKIDIEKRLEIESELIGNNINELKDKLMKASSEEEKTRLQNIIAKQMEIKNKIDSKAGAVYNDEMQSSLATDAGVENEISETVNEIEETMPTNDFQLEI